MIEFSIVGGGWRAEFFLRIAQALPEAFRVTNIFVRNPEKAEKFGEMWKVPTVTSLDDLLRASGEFVVTSVPWPVSPTLIREITARSIAVLAETPPAPDIDALNALSADVPARLVQVAEQYHLQPLHAARQAVIDSGRLGRVSQAQVSVAHGYHGVSLLRRWLGVEFDDAVIRATTFKSPLVGGPTREGPPSEARIAESGQMIATIRFVDRLGIFDFCGDQYWSWVRSNRVLIRGERGEINNLELSYLEDVRTPIASRFERVDRGQSGNLEGYFHAGYQVAGNWVYRNPFPTARLNDDEIAIATCLQKMSAFAGGGDGFYSLAEASQDHYLGILIDRAAASGEEIRSERQGWAW